MGRTRAYIALGSNLEGPRTQVETAFAELAALPRTEEAGRSRIYRSTPMGPPGQPDYLNAVAALDTDLAPEALLDALQAIEARHGRVRGPQRWGPRTLDLDLLLYGAETVNTERLVVPHPGLHERNFVLYPLYDLAPDLEVPGKGPLRALRAACPGHGLQVVDEQ